MKKKCTPRGIDPALLGRLRAAGCPMPEDDKNAPGCDLTIKVSAPAFTKIYNSRFGSEYIFAVRIENQCYARLEIQQFHCIPYWPTQLEWPLCQHELDEYRLPSGRKFPSRSVLNHRTGGSGALDPGGSLDGFVLAFSRQQIPDEYLHSFVVPVDLAVVDQYGRKHVSEIEVEVDRSATQKPLRKMKRPSSLFDPVEFPDESLLDPEPASYVAEEVLIEEFNQRVQKSEY